MLQQILGKWASWVERNVSLPSLERHIMQWDFGTDLFFQHALGSALDRRAGVVSSGLEETGKILGCFGKGGGPTVL